MGVRISAYAFGEGRGERMGKGQKPEVHNTQYIPKLKWWGKCEWVVYMINSGHHIRIKLNALCLTVLNVLVIAEIIHCAGTSFDVIDRK